MKSAFFCSTPYQILLAIQIKFSTNLSEEVDIYVLNHFNNANKITNNLKKNNLFDNVYLVECIEFSNSFSKITINRYIQKIIKFYNSKKIVDYYFKFDNISYDQVYFSSPGMIIQLALKELYKKNNNIKVNLYEDGTGGYSNNILRITQYKRIFNKTTGIDKIIDRYDSLMVFRPDLYSSNVDIPIIKIPNIDINNLKLRDMINSVFEYTDNYSISEKIIFLEQPISYNSLLNNRIKEIVEKVLSDDYIIKLHPRSNSEEYKGHKIYMYNFVPWEIIALNNNIEDKILISYYSTAVVSNKIIFNQEPKVILLFEMEELVDICQIPKDSDVFLEKFKKTYKDPTRIYIPKNMSQLKQYIKEAIYK